MREPAALPFPPYDASFGANIVWGSRTGVQANAPIRPANLTPARSRPGMDRGLQATTLNGRGDDFPADAHHRMSRFTLASRLLYPFWEPMRREGPLFASRPVIATIEISKSKTGTKIGAYGRQVSEDRGFSRSLSPAGRKPAARSRSRHGASGSPRPAELSRGLDRRASLRRVRDHC